MQVFPNGQAVMATYSLQMPIIGLIAHSDNRPYQADYMDKRASDHRLRRKLVSLRLYNTYTLFGTFIADARDLIDFAGSGPLNTDDHPVVMFDAPRFAYTQQAPACQRLLAMLDQLHPEPDQILQTGRTAEASAVCDRLQAYWMARNRFLHAGVGIQPTADVEQLLDQVQNPLLSIVRQSPDFDAAYNPLLAMAKQLHRIRPEAARHLLLELKAANPMRQDAKRLLDQIGVQK
jgi:spermidine synthase